LTHPQLLDRLKAAEDLLALGACLPFGNGG